MSPAHPALATIPAALRDPLLQEYQQVCDLYAEGRHQYVVLHAGRFCEVVYWILLGYGTGSWPAGPGHISQFPQKCQRLENDIPATMPRTVRITIPRMLPGIYDMRNNRDVGHVSAELDPNHMDATVALAVCQWVMAELVRVFHSLAPDDAQDVVDALVERNVPLVCEVDGVKRVLDPKMSHADKTLVVLHASAGPMTVADLKNAVEHSHVTRYRNGVLVPLHKGKMLELNVRADRVTLLPPGVKHVQDVLRARS